MSKPIHRIFNGETGEVIEREYTAAELNQQIADNERAIQYQAEAEAKTTARASALAKLAELGLTPDEIASL
jgi:DNA-binding NarL/FixJ family response regulator